VVSRSSLAVLVCSLWVVPSTTRADDALDDKRCLECHSDTDLSTRDALTGREYRLAIDTGAYARSVHGKLACRACHERGYAVVPHTSPRRRDPFRCLFCHRDDRALEGFQPEVRKRAVSRSQHVENVGVAFDCHACHDPHVFSPRPSTDEGNARVAWANAICNRCHGTARALAPFEDAKQAAVTHDFLPHTALHLHVTECVSCHGDDDALRHRLLPVTAARRDCTACHAQRAELLRDAYGARPGLLSDNASLLDNVYVIGATRAPALDRLSLAGFCLGFAFICVHALMRGLTRRRRGE
jgi:hypothetical protein